MATKEARTKATAAWRANTSTKPVQVYLHPDTLARLDSLVAEKGATGRAAVLTELINGGPVEPLAPTAQAKVDRAVAAKYREMHSEFQRQLHDAIQEGTQKQREVLHQREREIEQERAQLAALRQTLPGLMTQAEYRLLRGCLHPDRVPEDRREVFAKAFDLVTRLGSAVKGLSRSARKRIGWG